MSYKETRYEAHFELVVTAGQSLALLMATSLQPPPRTADSNQTDQIQCCSEAQFVGTDHTSPMCQGCHNEALQGSKTHRAPKWLGLTQHFDYQVKRSSFPI